MPALADREDITNLKEASISLVQAIKSAEKHIGGSAADASIDDDSWKPVYEVSIVKANQIFKVHVDAKTGEVIGSREDYDD